MRKDYVSNTKKLVRGFTLMELLIVVALIVVLATAMMVLLNVRHQIEKANNAKRKNDLKILRTALEEYYNDKGCYPRPEDICYGPPQGQPGSNTQNVCSANGSRRTVESRICKIAGKEPTSPDFKPYLPELPSDPEHPRYSYLYEAEAPRSTAGCFNQSTACQNIYPPSYSCTITCPKWYRAYSNLSGPLDEDSKVVGCYTGGCGIPLSQATASMLNAFGYDYGISSPNIFLQTAPSWICYSISGVCNGCGSSYQTCIDNAPGNNCNTSKIYGSFEACEADN